MLSKLNDIRNEIDFNLRKLISFRSKLSPKDISSQDLGAQKELKEFLTGFDLPSGLTKDSIKVLDVGCRNFLLAPVIDEVLGKFQVQIDGLEVDAYRRMHNFKSRQDYGEYYASLCRKAQFHAQDFLKWEQKVDLIFLLNPFVTPQPVRSWGLPISYLKPQEIFAHCAQLLGENGLLLVSSPNRDELSEVENILAKNQFKVIKKNDWHPSEKSVQKRPRLGLLCRLNNG